MGWGGREEVSIGVVQHATSSWLDVKGGRRRAPAKSIPSICEEESSSSSLWEVGGSFGSHI